MSKDCEEQARHKLEQKLEDRKKPKSTLYPSNNPSIREKIDNLMLVKTQFLKLTLTLSCFIFVYIRKEIDEYFENENESKKEIKFSELYVILN
jgi:hypothetical protein